MKQPELLNPEKPKTFSPNLKVLLDMAVIKGLINFSPYFERHYEAKEELIQAIDNLTGEYMSVMKITPKVVGKLLSFVQEVDVEIFRGDALVLFRKIDARMIVTMINRCFLDNYKLSKAGKRPFLWKKLRTKGLKVAGEVQYVEHPASVNRLFWDKTQAIMAKYLEK